MLEARQFDIYAWPATELLPLPQQAQPVAAAVAAESTSSDTSDATAAPATTPMDIWVEAAVAAMLLGVGALATARYLRRRHLKNHQ